MRRPELTLAVADHNVPTKDRAKGIADPESREQVATLENNAREFGIEYLKMDDIRQGIVHIVGPEQGWTLPGTTIVCGDSAYLHAWRVRRARVRHRHERSRACAGDADAC